MHRADDIIKRLPVPHRIVPVVFNAYGDPHPVGELFAQLPEHSRIGQLVPDAEVGKVHIGMPGKTQVGEPQFPGCFRHLLRGILAVTPGGVVVCGTTQHRSAPVPWQPV